jgi:hypothetical protein
MKKLLLIFACATQFFFAQNAPCNCPGDIAPTADKETPKEIFTFSTGQQIALCGFKEEGETRSVYSEFTLKECGEFDFIDFWGAVFTAIVSFDKDVISIKELKNLPTGKNRTFTDTHWSTETLKYVDGKLVRERSLNPILPRYDEADIDQTLKEYKAGSANYKDDVEVLMNQLFVAAISGSNMARSYFNDFAGFTPLDGAVLEEYKDLMAMLAEWVEK